MAINPLHTKLKNAIRIDRALRFVWQASPSYTIVSGMVLAVLGVLPLVSLYLVKLIIDEVTKLAPSLPETWSDPALFNILLYISLACGVGLLTAFFHFLADYLKKAQALAVSDHMFSVVHEKSAQVDLDFFESPKYRDTLFRAQSEGPYRPTSIVNGLFAAGQSGASFLAVAWLLFAFNPILPVAMILSAVPGIVLRLGYSQKIYSWQEKRTEDERRAYYFHWMLTGDTHAKEFRFFNLGGYFIDRFRGIRDTLRKEKLHFERLRAMGDLIAQSSAVVCVFISLAYIAFQAVRGEISIGDMVMYFQALQRGLGFLKTLLESGAQMYEDNLFLSHLYRFLKVKPLITPPVSPQPVPKNIDKGIEFNNVAFNYQNCEKKVIDCVNFSIKPGEVVALVGHNGSGKTTLVKLLSRLYDPDQGKVTLDGIDIKKFRPREYRKKISMVFQDHIRYQMSARENIFLGDIEQKEDTTKIKQAAKQSGIDQVISYLTSGYETILGRWFQNGEELSSGQWQMLAISRAFFKDSPIVVLDEPSSALDPETEALIFSRIKELTKDRAALIVTHRYSSVKLADKILVLDQGRIIEKGSHQELMALKGTYAHLFNTQASAYHQGDGK